MIRSLIILISLAGAAHAGDSKTDAPPPIRLITSNTDYRAELDRAETTPSAIERPIEPKTAVDWRVSRDGAKAEAGYLCGIGGIGPDSEPIPGGPASVYGHAGTFLGATVAVPLP